MWVLTVRCLAVWTLSSSWEKTQNLFFILVATICWSSKSPAVISMSAHAHIKWAQVCVRVSEAMQKGKEFVFLHGESCILEPHLVTDPVSVLPLSASECVCVCYTETERWNVRVSSANPFSLSLLRLWYDKQFPLKPWIPASGAQCPEMGRQNVQIYLFF